VRPVQRYVITRYEQEIQPDGGFSAGCVSLGEFDNHDGAIDIAQRLTATEEGAEFAQ
jgi:hypothetical protein